MGSVRRNCNKYSNSLIRLLVALLLVPLAWTPTMATAAGNVLEPDPTFGQEGFTQLEVDLLPSETKIIETQIDSMQRTVSLVLIDGAQSFLVRHLADGTEDTSFGTNGRTAFNDDMWTSGFRILTDGKILEVGTMSSRVILRRRLSNGAIDTTFGTNGVSQSPSFGVNRGFQSDAVFAVNGADTVNNIFVGITIASYGSNNQEIILSFDENGNLNGDFGIAGMAVLSPVQTSQSCLTYLSDIEIATNGNILAVIPGCDSSITGYSHTWVYSLNNQTGNRDSAFGNLGVTRLSSAVNSELGLLRICILADDSLLMFGTSGTYYWGPWSIASAKLLADGTLDSSYGTAGISETSISDDGNHPQITNVVELSNGSVALGATLNDASPSTGPHKNYVLQFTSNGTLDTSFNASGQLVIGVTQGQRGKVQSLSRRTDGSLIMGFARKTDRYVSELLRVQTNATLDASYLSNNSSSFDVTNYRTSVNSVSTSHQSDGKIVIAETTTNDRFGNIVHIVRYLANGQKDFSFGSGGTVVPFPLETQLEVKTVVQGPNGDLYVTAIREIPNQSGRSVVVFRMSSTGVVDTTYGVNGLATLPNTSYWYGIHLTEVLTDGKFLVVRNEGCDTYITQLLPNGNLDTSFDGATGTSDGNVQFAGFCAGSAIRLNGDIYIAGKVDQVNPAAIMKVDSNGLLVTNFGSQGVQSFPESDGGSGLREGYVGQLLVLSNNTILGIGESYLNNANQTALYAVSQEGVIDVNFDGAAGPGNGVVHFQPVQGTPFSLGSLGVADGDGFLIVNSTRTAGRGRIQVRRVLNNGMIDQSYGTNAVNQFDYPLSVTDFWVDRIEHTVDGKIFGFGGQENGSLTGAYMYQLRTYVPPTTTSPPNTAPPVTTIPSTSTTSTTVPVSSTSGATNFGVGTTLKQSALLSALKISVPKGGKVKVATKSSSICKMAGTGVRAIKAGSCVLSVTTTTKSGVKKTVTKKISVKKK